MTRGFGRFLRQNTIALLALFLALGGTSFAAASLINGKNIKAHSIAKSKLTNKAIKQLKGNRGPAGPPGAQGSQGVQGVQGVQGPPGPITGDLPAGVTLRGNYMVAGNNGGSTIHSAVSYGLRLSAPPTVNYITAGSTPPAACPGTVTNPQAAPGNLCVYEVEADNVTTFRGVCDPESSGCPFGPTASREGFAVFAAIDTAGSPLFVFGSWAVTAPTTAAPAAKSPANAVPTTR
jgi:hypothetical protein